jgi:hypothetical protein
MHVDHYEISPILLILLWQKPRYLWEIISIWNKYFQISKLFFSFVTSFVDKTYEKAFTTQGFDGLRTSQLH